MITEAHRWLIRAVAVSVAAAAIAACGSSSNSSSSSSAAATSSAAPASTSSQTSAATGAGSGGAGAEAVTNYLSYIGGKAGKADPSLPPVTIGWINQQGGQQSIGPLATNGAQMAVKYINRSSAGWTGIRSR